METNNKRENLVGIWDIISAYTGISTALSLSDTFAKSKEKDLDKAILEEQAESVLLKVVDNFPEPFVIETQRAVSHTRRFLSLD